MQKPSFKQLAKVAKVSPSTVTRVAKGQGSVDPDIRARVRKAAEALGIDLERKRNEAINLVAFMLATATSYILSRRKFSSDQKPIARPSNGNPYSCRSATRQRFPERT